MVSKLAKLKLICWLELMRIQNYSIDDDLTVNVKGDVYLINKKFKILPVKFGVVEGDFICHNGKLISLIGAPHTVLGSFTCHKNNLTSLKFGPKEVKGYYDCSNNHLTSLLGAPNEIGEYFNCAYNQLMSLEHGPLIVGQDYICNNNSLTSLKGIAQKVDALYCRSNKLTHLNDLPKEIEALNCSCNEIKNIDNLYFNYYYLDFTDNPIEIFSYETIKNWDVENSIMLCDHLIELINNNGINIKILSSFKPHDAQLRKGEVQIEELKEKLKIIYENELMHSTLENKPKNKTIKI